MTRKYKKPTKKVKLAEQGNMLQSIWQLHTDVQEQILRLRSVPVKVLPESAKVVGEKLYLTVDENEKQIRLLMKSPLLSK
ncbi:MAG: hypothetical protein LBP85_04480 [Prevotellaceae bacterium]|jgi:hypothetical protein|nr:hypothetical protein [Prevotellaceae bacterium]